MKLRCSFQLLSALLVLTFMCILVLQHILSHLHIHLARKSIVNLRMKELDANRLKQILQAFIQTAEKENVKYFIFYGTLLGAFRHEGRIPWDDDIDVIVSAKDQEVILRRFNELLNPDFAIVETGDRTRSLKMFQPFQSHAMWDKTWRYPYMDIAFYDENETHIWDTFGPDSHHKFLKSDIFPLAHVTFEGNAVYAPNDIKKVLTKLYGDYHECVVPLVGHKKEHSWQKDSYKVKCKDL